MINVFQPTAGAAELAAVADVLASNWLGPGPRVAAFQEAFGALIERPAEELIATSSATDALFHAIAALGLGPGDDVVLPTVSFVGAAHAVRASGARVVLCDVDAETLNPAVAHVERALTAATRAIVVLHYGGDPGAVAGLAELATDRSLLLVEDAAIGLGSTVAGRACGTFGDVGVWSFDAMKVLTTGEGGMAWCRDPAVADRVRRSTRLGLGPSGFGLRREHPRWWEIDPPGPGRRGAMNDIAAAMGLVQLGRLDQALRRRAEIAAAYDDGLRDLPWAAAPAGRPADAARTFHWIRTAAGVRDRLAAHLLDHDVYTTYKYWPLHRMRMYRSAESFPGADEAAATTLLLPLHRGLSDADVEHVVDAIRAFEPGKAGQ